LNAYPSLDASYVVWRRQGGGGAEREESLKNLSTHLKYVEAKRLKRLSRVTIFPFSPRRSSAVYLAGNVAFLSAWTFAIRRLMGTVFSPTTDNGSRSDKLSLSIDRNVKCQAAPKEARLKTSEISMQCNAIRVRLAPRKLLFTPIGRTAFFSHKDNYWRYSVESTEPLNLYSRIRLIISKALCQS
jgi:hypothetical protein